MFQRTSRVLGHKKSFTQVDNDRRVGQLIRERVFERQSEFVIQYGRFRVPNFAESELIWRDFCGKKKRPIR